MQDREKLTAESFSEMFNNRFLSFDKKDKDESNNQRHKRKSGYVNLSFSKIDSKIKIAKNDLKDEFDKQNRIILA